MHLAHLVVHAGVEQDPLGDGGLAGVDVGADADVADAGEVDGHRCFLELSLGLGEPPGSRGDHIRSQASIGAKEARKRSERPGL